MDIRKVTSEEIQNMTDEQRRSYAKAFVQAVKVNPNLKATFHDPVKNQTITLSDLIQKIGEEKAADFLYQTLTVSKAKKATLTAAEYEKLIQKSKQGTLTENEKQMLQMASSAFANSAEIQYQKNATGVLLGLTDFSQNGPKYSPTIADVISISNLLSLSAISIGEDSDTKDKRTDLFQLKAIGNQIGDDILNTWKASLTDEVPTEHMIAGLCQALFKTAKQANIKLPEADILFNYLEIDKNAYRMKNGN